MRGGRLARYKQAEVGDFYTKAARNQCNYLCSSAYFPKNVGIAVPTLLSRLPPLGLNRETGFLAVSIRLTPRNLVEKPGFFGAHPRKN